jgi:hypothetical protein
MRPKIAEIVSSEDWQLFEQIKAILSELSDTFTCRAFILNLPVSRDIAESNLFPDCHTITRALKYFLPVTVHSGHIFEKRVGDELTHAHQHSWLTRTGGNDRIIFDPVPLGVVSGPALYIQNYAFHFKQTDKLYLPMKSRKFRAGVAAVRLAIRAHIKSAS